MSVEKNMPAIRFKGFGGEWNESSIGEICGSTFGGGTPSTNDKDFWQGEIPWIQSSDLKDGILSSVTAKKYITKLAVNKSATKLISGNSIAIVTRVGVGKLSLMQGEYATSQDFLSLSDLKIDSQYAVYVIWKQLQIEKEQVQGTSIKGITKDELLGKCISYPETEEEQTAIGNTFQKLDNLINQHQQKHDKLSNIKKAMLEKMFPKQGETMPEIRFKGFSGEWEEKHLNHEVELFSGLTYSPKDIRKDGVFVIRSSNVKNGQLVQADNVYVNPEVVNCSNVEKGDIIVVVRNGSRSLIGKHAQVDSCMDKTVIGAFMTGIRGKQPAFINALFDTNQFTSQVEKNLGATINQITNGAFNSMVFMFPDVLEQTAIGNYFQKLDALINQHQQQITKLNNIKQACLSKMFV
ncbi:restriction endonuclease subunit S [Neiella marina]|uniref:Restriction endonuclease subunit S n=1 Tax=Neiella holothuriorum TaxID=2870530 RepID=A0ABS7EI34_9GAMM|nr:restriction endonuclease subunit S [Neiella holothuriorum]MBW8192001.1 restriction endonuclease subunit S [Neiella holothuriorum]